MSGDRHCGACGAKFETAKELMDHLKICPLAKMGVNVFNKAFDKNAVEVDDDEPEKAGE